MRIYIKSQEVLKSGFCYSSNISFEYIINILTEIKEFNYSSLNDIGTFNLIAYITIH